MKCTICKDKGQIIEVTPVRMFGGFVEIKVEDEPSAVYKINKPGAVVSPKYCTCTAGQQLKQEHERG